MIAVRLERIKDLGKPKEPPRIYIATLRHYVRQLETAPIVEDEEDLPANPAPVQSILESERPRLLREEKGYGLGQCLKLDLRPLPRAGGPLAAPGTTGNAR